MPFLTKQGRWINAGLAWLAAVTSLYWSIVLGWIPCDFCWYERICMYPLALIYGVSLIQKHHSRAITLPLAGVGIILSLYHYLLQVVPYMSNSISCTSIVSCAIPEFRVFGFVTPPFLSLLAFVGIFIVDSLGGLLSWKQYRPVRTEGNK